MRDIDTMPKSERTWAALEMILEEAEEEREREKNMREIRRSWIAIVEVLRWGFFQGSWLFLMVKREFTTTMEGDICCPEP